MEKVRPFSVSNASNEARHGVAKEDGGGEAKFIEKSDEIFSETRIGRVFLRVEQVGVFDGAGKGPVKHHNSKVLAQLGEDFVPQ